MTLAHVLLIKPCHYDDDGYPLQWHKSMIPSNSLACMHGLAEAFVARGGLGPDVEIRIRSIDESNMRVRPERLVDRVRREGGKVFVGLVGVQSNQYPRAFDLARAFRLRHVPVCIGGFHVSGVLSMFGELSPELKEAIDLGISLFAREAEDGRFDVVLRDAFTDGLKPVYNWIDKLPNLDGAPIPILPRSNVDRTYTRYSSFDLGRGCPFQCSFCTIINVQGRVSRFRSADDLERIVRENRAIGIDRFMLTDDNLARNRNWEACFDRLIELREKEGIRVRLQVQVDTLCHKIPGFIEKAAMAGADQVFMGVENINPDNLMAAKKRQNRIAEYRDLMMQWKAHGAVLFGGYILGFPHDTKESIRHDIEIIKRELPLDLIYFTVLTPLPGCEDHKVMVQKGQWMDPDLNKYDLNHRVTHHNSMSDEEWDEAYRLAWDTFYTNEHMITILKRGAALKVRRKALCSRLTHFREFHRRLGVHPLEGGILRKKYRKDRRTGLPREGIIPFYARYLWEFANSTWGAITTYAMLRWKSWQIWRDPRRREYVDAAIAPIDQDHLGDLELFSSTRGGAQALDRWKTDRSRARPKASARG